MSDMSPEQIKSAVDAVLAAARLPVDDEEYARLLQMYPVIQAQVAELRIPEARYREPELIFRPHPAL